MSQRWRFGPYILNEDEPPLRCGTEHVRLEPKAFSVLCHLVQHKGRLVSKDELIKAVWPRVSVYEDVVKNNISEIREALKDNWRHPLYIETIPRHGYRFIAEVESSLEAPKHADFPIIPYPNPKLANESFVGRQSLISELNRQFPRTSTNQRSIVFLTGEAGIGKSTIVEMFLEQLAGQDVLLLRGQCIEHYGVGEAFLPLLDAISRLCRHSNAKHFIEKIRKNAPTWLEQMPSLLSPEQKKELRRETLGASKGRMLREFCELIEELSMEKQLILVLEDLHWSDYSTLDFLNLIARRPGPTSLLIIGTSRKIQQNHPLFRIINELRNIPNGCCSSFLINHLNIQDVEEYIEQRFQGGGFVKILSPIIFQRSEGNPLFMVNLVNHFVDQGIITRINESWVIDKSTKDIEIGMPENIRQMIEIQINKLNPKQYQILEVASAIGVDFSTDLLAGATDFDINKIEEICENLVRRGQMLLKARFIELPNGTVSSKYIFQHAMYAELFYEHFPTAKRIVVHERLGQLLEDIYGFKEDDVAPEIARHFELSRNFKKAIDYLSRAALRSTRHYANQESLRYLDRALQLTERLQKIEQEQMLVKLLQQQVRLKRSMYQMSEAKEDLDRIMSIAKSTNNRELEVKTSLELAGIYYWTARSKVLDIVESAVSISQILGNDNLLVQAKCSQGYWAIHINGWTQDNENACVAGLDNAKRIGDANLIGIRQCNLTMAYFYHSRYRLALQFAEEAMKTLLEVGDAHYYYLLSQHYYAWSRLHLGDFGHVLSFINSYLELGYKNDNRLGISSAMIMLSWLNSECFQFNDGLGFADEALQIIRGQDDLSPYIQGSLIQARNLLGLGEYLKAFAIFEEILNLTNDKKIIIESNYFLFLHRGLTEYWFAQNNLDKAADSANELCRLASLREEVGYLALSYAWLADIANKAGNRVNTEQSIQRAIDTIGESKADYPLVAWRVYAKVAELYEQFNRQEEAKLYRELSKSLIFQLADSMQDDLKRKEAFLATQQIQIALGTQAPTSMFISIL